MFMKRSCFKFGPRHIHALDQSRTRRCTKGEMQHPELPSPINVPPSATVRWLHPSYVLTPPEADRQSPPSFDNDLIR